MIDHQKKRVAAVTLGCKLNYAETSSILDHLCQQGWQLSSIAEGADLIIIHTCAVTKQAEKKCRQKIRGIIRKNPASRISVIGCYAQLNPDELSSIDGIHAILAVTINLILISTTISVMPNCQNLLSRSPRLILLIQSTQVIH